ncbi:MAG: phosphoribosylformylglycinamidine synthase [Oscillospiraceae bacterium]|jgi:phosphoribosylformylglycinamidine synthase|nr:phosphoribosylformylglycinamidine synthase [Oscillospiraceae bacterium]
MVYRCYTEKKSGFDIEASGILSEARDFLLIGGISRVRLFNRYDIEGIDAAVFAEAKQLILSEPPLDDCYDALPELRGDAYRLAVEALPGQYDQRADSCAQCIQMITQSEKPLVKTAKVYVFYGTLSESDRRALRAHLINPVDAREAVPEKPETLAENIPAPAPVEVIAGFTALNETCLRALLIEYGLAMDLADLTFMQSYFRDTERRDPTVTELRCVDTYWSDHCRHTTFSTHLTDISIDDPHVEAAYRRYLALRRDVYGAASDARPVTLMDIATIAAKALKKQGKLPDLDMSEEVNACSIHIDVETDSGAEDWLLMFKNETHNHPTEIEPFGGAATCIGGAIRDPLSGRSYVYQAMRVTGAGDPRASVSDTLPGKLPQRRLTAAAARGYSSYGNQIGLATGLVHEIYHPGYAAKRMEIGAVVGAVKSDNVVRETPEAGDAVLLLGGRTGRDGIGGATGSSKTHSVESVAEMASEVQKGNAPEERKIQRLFRNPEVTRLIKRCNDFGAGGVSVAIGELADGLDIDLSAVRKKYEGLGATELAISESQERMAVVVRETDADSFIEYARAENLEAYRVAVVTAEPYMTMRFEGKIVARLSREFLSSNGAEKFASASVAAMPDSPPPIRGSAAERLLALSRELTCASQKGLMEMFDSTVGAGGVLAPYGGKTQKTPAQAMAALIPLEHGDTSTCSVMAFGFDPYLSERNGYSGARYAVTTSIAKLVAAGADPDKAYLTFQEYFEKLRDDPSRWGKPLAALLGALDAQMGLETAAIGGKDSMSGTFMDLDAPPTLVSFAIAPADAANVISPEFKRAGNRVMLFPAAKALRDTKRLWRELHREILAKNIVSAWAVSEGGVLLGLASMSFGNNIGFEAAPDFDACAALADAPGAIIAEVRAGARLNIPGGVTLGKTTAEPFLRFFDERVSIARLLSNLESTLEPVFPQRAEQPGDAPLIEYAGRHAISRLRAIPKPRAVVFAFPGTNGETDAHRALVRAGADTRTVVIRNLTPDALRESIEDARRAILESQILVLPGGFSGGDEPDGSAKFITAFFRAPLLTDAVHTHLKSRDGLMLGVCNGFQALIKLGLVPYGEITPPKEGAPTLTYNVIGRHQARYVYTRVASVKSPWFSKLAVGEVYSIPISHGEGRFVACEDTLSALRDSGQLAAQYCDELGAPSMNIAHNPNGSEWGIEAIFSPDGRVIGKMGHFERLSEFVGVNIHGVSHQPIFESGVEYYR